MADFLKQQSSLNPKDVLVVLPFFGSALAISWEVGSFVPIGRGAFSMFSLSEHLLFALQALPLALAGAGLLAIYSMTAKAILSHRIKWFWTVRAPRLARPRRRVIRTALIAIFIAAGILFLTGIIERLASFLVVSAAVFLFAVAASLSLAAILTPTSMVLAGCFGLLFAMGLGFDNTRALLRRDVQTDILMDGQTRKAIIIRMGERGLLVFDRSAGVFSFLKQDAIRSLNWERPAFPFSVR